MRNLFPAAHLALTLVILVWDVALAGRIMHVRRAPRSFAVTTALCGFFILPALAIHVATSSIITGRALVLVSVLWPATLVLFVLQALLATGRRLVNPVIGIPIFAYNTAIAASAILSLVSASGFRLLELPLSVLVAQNDVLAFATGGAALTSPLFVAIPILAPAFPPLRGLTATFRVLLAVYALVWLVFLSIAIPKGQQILRTYRQFDSARLVERPAGDFRIGAKILPDVARQPAVLATRSDIELVRELDLQAVSVTIVPDAATGEVLDSIARVVEPLRTIDSMRVIVTLGYRGKIFPTNRPSGFDRAARLRAVEQVVRRIRPDILIPAEDPYGAGTRAFGLLPVETWRDYIAEASRIAKRLRPRTRIGVSASSFGTRDSTLYAWAVSPNSGVDIAGFSLFPRQRGAQDLQAAMRAADRWMQQIPSTKDHWVFNAGGYPMAHGEKSQERALWGTLAWATSKPQIKGFIISSASDYGGATGLEAPDGRHRPAAGAVVRAIVALREAIGRGPAADSATIHSEQLASPQ